MSEKICPDCGHSLEDNEHGFDQNDFEYDSETGKFIYLGSCAYCKECNPALNNKDTK
jgi:hypothetical protein